MTRFEINPGFSCLKEFILQLDTNFSTMGDTLKNGRNHLKIIHYRGIKLCVKSFGRPHFLNQLAYSFLRPSKAERSYNYGLRLIEMGIQTPEPIAWINYYDHNRMLQKSYYVSLFLEHDFCLGDIFDFELADRLEVLSAFSVWVCKRVHDNGVLHKDLSGGNILIRQIASGEYSFFMIDLNRIRFSRKIGFRKRMANLRRIHGTAMCLGTIAHFYSMHYQQNPVWSAMNIGMERLFYTKFLKTKRKIKAGLRTITGKADKKICGPDLSASLGSQATHSQEYSMKNTAS